MIDNIQTDTLTWTAFRYVAGEMSSDEAEAFELQLADDQSSRDAVVRAVELSSAVLVALPESMRTGPAQPKEPSRRNWLLAATSAACVVLGLVVFSQSQLTSPDPASSRPTVSTEDSSEAGQLIGLWTSEVGDADGVVGNDELSSESILALNAADSLTVPDWMIAALTHEIDGEESDAEYPREMN